MEHIVKTKESKLIDKQYSIKKFFKLLFDNIDFTQEKIRTFQQNEEYSKVRFFNDIDELVKFSVNKYIYTVNSYFTLATLKADAESGTEENLSYRYFLAFDFDKKDLGEDLTHKDILNRFKAIPLHYHALVDSGNGYHAYVCINKTNDLKKVAEVQKALCIKLGADSNAIKSTQVLRIPYTFNIKDKPKKEVKLVSLDDRHKIRRYDIDFLYEKNCVKSLREQSLKDSNIKFTLNNTNIPKCIEKMLTEGSAEGDRYADLQKIVVMLRQRNKRLEEVKAIVKEWSIKSNFDDNLDYRVENIYNNLTYVSMNCKECKHKDECFNTVLSDFDFKEDEKLITISETHAKKLKSNNRRGAKIMKSNDLLVYSILKLHLDGLTVEELTKELTYSKKKVVKNVALSEKTLREALKSLETNGFVECIKGNARAGIKNLYKLKSYNAKIELVYNVSFSATYECIKGNISPEELRLYNYMRYLHHKEQRENPKALKGNLFQVNQVDLAKDFGVTQGRISQMIDNLIDEKLLGIWYRQQSKNNGFDFNIYRLNY